MVLFLKGKTDTKEAATARENNVYERLLGTIFWFVA